MTEVIRLEDVSKRFVIVHEKNRSFQDVVVNLFKSNGSREEFWALKNTSFSVQRGETLGIIGYNGSGKSTILKLISRIIEPTSGKVTVNGSVSPLLELGAGFHPELSGRDNVFLNGSLLGFSRKKMERIFDEVVAFSELEQFIDVPIKHYSSGMYMRLAFAVAINVDPDILLIDEVLAVGDEAFQEKCFQKIVGFQKLGKTIVLVSHSLGKIESMCDRAIWIDHGQIRSMGDCQKVVHDYLGQVYAIEDARAKSEHQTAEQKVDAGEPASRWVTGGVRIGSVEILGAEREGKHVFQTGDNMVVRLRYVADDEVATLPISFSVSICDHLGNVIHRALCLHQQLVQAPSRQGVVQLEYVDLPLLEGSYSLSAAVWPTDAANSPFDAHSETHRFSVRGADSNVRRMESGVVSLQHRWLDGEGTELGPDEAIALKAAE